MNIETTTIVHYKGQRSGACYNMELPLSILDGLEPDDASMLIRAAQGVAARAAEDAFIKCIESRVINTYEKYVDGTLQHVYKDLNRKG